MTKEQETLKKLGYIEPLIVKAGDDRVLLGLFHKPPPLDVRVVAEDNYKILLSAMEEQSVKFGQWLGENYTMHYSVYWKGVYPNKIDLSKSYTTKQLYEIFNKL